MTSFRLLSRSIILVLMLELLTSQARAVENVKYFWTVEVDQTHALLCLHPVDAKLTGKARCCRVTYDKQGRIVLVEYLSAGRQVIDNGTGVAQVKVEYQDGFERRSYLNTFGRSMTCNGGFNHERFKMDKESHRGSLFLYDEFGNPTTDQTGIARYQWELDDNGFITKELKMDADGGRIANNDGIYEERYKLDDKGRVIEQRYFGKEGQLIADGNGVAFKKLKWNNGHNVIEVQNFGPDELPLGRNGVAKMEIAWDDRDNRTEMKYYDDNGKLVHITKNVFDVNGNMTERQQFEDVGKLRAEGVAKSLYQFDESNHLLHLAVYDKDGKLIDDDDETAEEFFKYDEKGNLVEKSYKKANGSFGVDKSEGFAIKRYVYDGHGHIAEDRFFDADDKPMMLEAGFAIERRKFNDHEDQTEVSYFDKLDRPVDLKSGIQRIVWKYDDAGKTIEVHDYDATGKEVNPDSLRTHGASINDAAASASGSASVLKSTEGAYAFKYNTSLWEQSREQISEKADFALLHKSGNSFGLIFHHVSDDAPADVLKSVMSDLEGSMTDVSLLRKEYKSVNNHDALFAQIQANIKDVPYIYVQYIFKTKKGHVIIMCGAPKTSFTKLEPEMMGFINGMSITD